MGKKATTISATGSRRGFTLIEILISVVILASAVVLILQAFARSAYAAALAKNRLTAYAFASAKMAEVEVGAYQAETPKTNGQFRIGQEQFRWHVERTPSTQDPHLELITLTVDWAQGRRMYEAHVSTLQRLPMETP